MKAGALSWRRLTLVVPPMEETVIMNLFKTLPVAASNIRLWTENYPVLNKLKQVVLMGETKRPLQPELHQYWSGREQLTVEDDTRLWGSKVSS